MFLAELSNWNISLPQLLIGVGVALLVWLSIATTVILMTFHEKKLVRRRHWLSVLIYWGYLGLIAVLAVSAFGSLLQYGYIAGFPLLVHITAAGAFVFLMVAIAFLYLPNASDAWEDHEERLPSWWAIRWSAWALVGSSLTVAASMLFSMLPLLDSEGLRYMATLHRYAGLAVVASAILHSYSLIWVRLGWR